MVFLRDDDRTVFLRLGGCQLRAPVLLVEVLPAYTAESERRTRQDQLMEALHAAGYDALHVSKTPSLDFAGLEPIDRFEVHSDMTRCDYVFVPNEEVLEILTG